MLLNELLARWIAIRPGPHEEICGVSSGGQGIADHPGVKVVAPQVVLALEGVHACLQSLGCGIGALAGLLHQLIGDRCSCGCVGHRKELGHPMDEQASDVGLESSRDRFGMSKTDIVFFGTGQVYDNVLDHGVLAGR